jgi:PAS domain S-box-containing protein
MAGNHSSRWVVHGVEMRMRRWDGKIVWMRINARKIQDIEQGIIYYEGSLEDITEHKNAEKAQEIPTGA